MELTHSQISEILSNYTSSSEGFVTLQSLIMKHKGVVHSKSKCNKQPRFSWSLIYEKHRRFAPRLGRVAPKSDTSNTKKEPLLWAPQD